jgi:hypothetical protein
MNNLLRSLACAALLAATIPAMANNETSTEQQPSLHDLRADFEAKRDRLTGADQLETSEAVEANAFFDAPIDTSDAPEQTQRR